MEVKMTMEEYKELEKGGNINNGKTSSTKKI